MVECGIGQDLAAVIEQGRLKLRDARVGQAREHLRVGEGRAERGQDVVRERSEDPADREGADVGHPDAQAVRPDQRDRERDRHEGEEGEVDGGEELGGEARAEDVVEELGGVVAEEEPALGLERSSLSKLASVTNGRKLLRLRYEM